LEREGFQCAHYAKRTPVSFLREFLYARPVDRDDAELSGDEETMGKDERCYREQA
jgi:hypothetical protein